MSLDEHLRRSLGSLAERLQEETKRQLATISDELGDVFESERASAVERAVADSKAANEQAIQEEIQAAVADAEARAKHALEAAQAEAREAREAGRLEGLEIGRSEGKAAAKEEGRQEGLEIGRKEGKEEGREAGKQEGLEIGRREGTEAGRLEGLEQGRREGSEQGRREGLEEGRREGAEQGRREGLEQGRQEGLDQGRRDGEHAARAGREESKEAVRAELRALELAAEERLVAAIRAIDRGRSLSEILETLVSSAGREARRVGVLIVRSGQLRGWRFIGFGSPLDDRHDFDVPAAGAGLVAEAARTGSAASGDSATRASVPSFAELPAGREMLAVPVPMSGQVVAVLYADQGPADVPDANVRVGWPATLEVLARHAARSLEAITAFRAAQVLTERPDVPGGKGGSDAAGSARGENEDPAQAARRYARLLISEIKMYHEAAVVAGRREGNLATRLGGEIARARALYEQRVPAEARKGQDYFQEELVRTLADGDARLLQVKS